MKTLFVENEGESQKIYNTILVRPENLNVFSNGMPGRILRELGRQPQCAMDLARKLKEHEQNIYYHLKKLRDAGLIRLANQENRAGMTAKIYELVSPVVAAKLYEEGYRESKSAVQFQDTELTKLLEPFVKNGKMNSMIIVGYPYPHGKHDSASVGDVHIFDFALLMGRQMGELRFSNYKFDVDVSEEDIRNQNIILFGNNSGNSVIEKVNDKLPVFFNDEGKIVSRESENIYDDPMTGMILKLSNPLNKNKKMLLLGGIRSRGLKAAVIAFTRYYHEIVEESRGSSEIVKIVQGLDRDNDKEIDAIKILE